MNLIYKAKGKFYFNFEIKVDINNLVEYNYHLLTDLIR